MMANERNTPLPRNDLGSLLLVLLEWLLTLILVMNLYTLDQPYMGCVISSHLTAMHCRNQL